MIHFGYDAKRLFQNATGLGNYSRTLLRHLAQFYPSYQYHLFSPNSTILPQSELFTHHKAFTTHSYTGGSRHRSFRLTRQAAQSGVQLFHGLSNELPFDSHKGKIPTVVTIHDLIFLRYPNQYPWIDRKLYQLKFKHACRKADRIIAISEQTKNDILEFYGIPEEKVRVVHQTCDDRFREPTEKVECTFIRNKYDLPSEFILYVGSVTERKGLLDLVKAWSGLPPSLSIPLVIVGEGKKYKKRVQEYIAKEGLENQIFWLGQVPDENLPAIYQMATALVYPSIFEGFGIPIIEALFCHTPVLTTKASALPEAGGPGALYAEPSNTESLQTELTKLLDSSSLREKLVKEGKMYVERLFMPRKVTEDMMNIYQEMIK